MLLTVPCVNCGHTLAEHTLMPSQNWSSTCNLPSCGCPGARFDFEAAQEPAPQLPERTPDGHPQVWLLYKPEPFPFDGPEDQEINLWVRRCDVFTSRHEAIAHLDNLLGRQIAWRPYHDLFPELWIAEDRGQRWLMCPSPVDPPGRQA